MSKLKILKKRTKDFGFILNEERNYKSRHNYEFEDTEVKFECLLGLTVEINSIGGVKCRNGGSKSEVRIFIYD